MTMNEKNAVGHREALGAAMRVTEHVDDLPSAPDVVPTLDFDREQWPPIPRGAVDAPSRRATITTTGPLTEVLEAEIRRAAIASERVQRSLGDRFAHISTDYFEIGKGHSRDCAAPLATRLIFFSHTHNVAVEVEMTGAHPKEVRVKEGYQPSEGLDEIAEAICLAKADARIKDRVQLLAGHAILLPTSAETLGSGHRMLRVTFTDPSETVQEKPALFSAVVDLIDRRVLMARQEAPPQPRKATEGSAHHAE